MTLTAAAQTGSKFEGWFTDCSGSDASLEVEMDQDKTCTASFTKVDEPPPGSLSVSPTTGFDASGNESGPFSPSSKTYTVSNTGGTAINYGVSKNQSWLTLSETGGPLEPGASAAVAVSINSSAESLSAGTHSDTVTFTNTTNGNGDTSRPVTVTVNAEESIASVTIQSASCTLSGAFRIQAAGSASGPVSTVVDFNQRPFNRHSSYQLRKDLFRSPQ